MDINKSSWHPREWGTEEHIVNNGVYCGKRLLVNARWMSTIQYHVRKTETLYVTEGRFVMQLFGEMSEDRAWEEAKRTGQPWAGIPLEESVMVPGDSLTITPRTVHRFIGLAAPQSVFLEFSTPSSDEDSYRLAPRAMVPDAEWKRLLDAFVRAA